MFEFSDNQGHQWSALTTLGTANRLRKDGVNLLDTKRVSEILADPIELFNLLFLICEKQAIKLGIDDEDFGARLVGVAPEAANTLVEALEDFFRQAGKPAMATLIKKLWAATQREQESAVTLMNTEKMDKMMQDLIDKSMREAEEKMDDLAGKTSGK